MRMLIQFLKTKFHLSRQYHRLEYCLKFDQLVGGTWFEIHILGSDSDFICQQGITTALSFFQIVRQTDRLDLSLMRLFQN
jgi:hypothetical protein